jgi:hypothetical protein
MAEVKTYLCDSCGKLMPQSYNPSSGKVYIPVGKESCPAGGAAIENRKSFDICPECMAKAINELLNKWTPYDYHTLIAQSIEEGHSLRLYLKHVNPRPPSLHEQSTT